MALLEIKKYPEKILKERASPVETFNGALQKLIDDMIETMYAAPGIGLAAPQVGVSKRLIVTDVSSSVTSRTDRQEEYPLIVLINPEIVYTEGEVEGDEGCLSIPGYLTVIRRAEKIKVKGLDRKGRPVEIEGTGLLSRALQHEIDHLNGVLVIDRISPIKREFFRKRYMRALREGS
ncbi:MAG: peptide deformylase [Nitrospirae bacterium]|nr:peptide deformylase [Nitrospirota bacterium]